MNKIEKLCINFIWKDKRHEVNKQTLCLPIEQGGLNMVNLKDFDNSLKITWVRKLYSNEPDWAEFAHYYKIHYLESKHS